MCRTTLPTICIYKASSQYFKTSKKSKILNIYFKTNRKKTLESLDDGRADLAKA